MPDQTSPTRTRPPPRTRAARTPAPVTGAGSPVATGSGPRWCTRDAARSWSPCCSRWSASPRSSRCAPTTSTTPTSSLREQDLIDVLNGLAGTSQRARSEIDRLEQHRRDLQSDSAPAGGGAGAGPAAGRHARHPGRAGAGHRARASGSPSPSRPGPVDIDSILDTVEELRVRRRRGDAVQRPGPGGRPDLVRGRGRRLLRRRARCSPRRTSSTSSATRTPSHGRASSSTRARPRSCATTGPTCRSTSWSRSTSSRVREPVPPGVRRARTSE